MLKTSSSVKSKKLPLIAHQYHSALSELLINPIRPQSSTLGYLILSLQDNSHPILLAPKVLNEIARCEAPGKSPPQHPVALSRGVAEDAGGNKRNT